MPRSGVAFRIILSMPSGPALSREYTWEDVAAGAYPQWPFSGPPTWLREPESIWADPHMPHEFRGMVPRGHEDGARELLWPEP